MRGIDIDDVVNNLLISLKENYIEDLARMEVALLEYKLHKISLRRAGSYIDSPKWIKNKKATINPQNKNNGCFAYAIITSLIHNKIDNHPEIVSNLRPYIHDYNWQGIYFPARPKDWKKFDNNSKSIALNMLFVPNDSENIRLA